MATPEERRKELRRNPTNYLARANMGKYRAYLRERLAKKGVDPKKIDIKQEDNKFVFVSPNNQKKITTVDIPPPVNEKKFVPSRAKGVDDTALINKIKSELERNSEGTFTVRKNSNPPKFEKRSVGGAQGRKERRGPRKEGTGKTSDALKIASLVGIGGVTLAGVRYLYKGGKIFAKTPLGQKTVNMASALGKKVINAFKKKKAEKQAESPRDASAMKQSSTKRKIDKSLFTKRKKEAKEKVDDVRDIPKKTTGVTDKPPAGAKNTSMSKTTKPKANRDKTFTKRANKDRDKQNERSKQDMAYDQATNPKKYLDPQN